MKKIYLYGALLTAAFAPLKQFAQTTPLLSTTYEWKEASSNGYTYKYVTNDPMKARFYTLKNGLTLILSQNKQEPRIAVNIPVRTGSNNDPADHTGLAHYLEHLMFKGTNKFGTLDWSKEKPLLDSITLFYDQYNKIPVTNTAARKAQYHKIDSISGVASHYSIANEYDKLMSSIGSKGTNAYTSVEQTVYVENIPSNSLEKFIEIQAERFRNPQFRIFHTELEAVYEEKNRHLDNDNSKAWELMNETIFPTSNYGQQTTIGTIDHLKNPSLIAIRNYYEKYYVPNNMAIVMAGDFDFDEVVKLADKYFTYKQPTPVQEYQSPIEPTINGPIEKTVLGPDAESVMIGFRIGKANTHESMMADLLSSLLSNGSAGLIDLNLNLSQKLLGGGAFVDQMKDYGTFLLSGKPKEGQTLEQVKDLLLSQLDSIKSGKFDHDLLKAVVDNYKLDKLKGLDNNNNRVSSLTNDFVFSKGADWAKEVDEFDAMQEVTAEELIAFTKTYFTSKNYVVIYKKKGEDKNTQKVEKPEITPVETNAGKNSDFVTKMNAIQLPEIKPVWLDFQKDMQIGTINKAPIYYVNNKENDLFDLYYYYDLGAFNNKLLPYAIDYLNYIGTKNKSSEEITKGFYKIASNFDHNSENEVTYLHVSGLNKNFGTSVSEMENLIKNCIADEDALKELKNRISKTRQDSKLNKGQIARGLNYYARYGSENPFNYDLTDEEINNIKASDLIDLIHKLPSFEHKIVYYGPLSLTEVSSKLIPLHQTPTKWLPTPEKKVFKPLVQSENKVFFNDYNMVQSEIYWNRNLMPFNVNNLAINSLFNNYFGGNMGSVVFQTIRESKALAYSTYAYVAAPTKKEDPFNFIGYVGTQADKFDLAIPAMNALIDTLPMNESNFDNAVTSLKKDLATERTTKASIVFRYFALQKLGLSKDPKQDIYNTLGNYKMPDLKEYHDKYLSQKAYFYSIVASKDKVTEAQLKKLGKVETISLKQIFGY